MNLIGLSWSFHILDFYDFLVLFVDYFLDFSLHVFFGFLEELVFTFLDICAMLSQVLDPLMNLLDCIGIVLPGLLVLLDPFFLKIGNLEIHILHFFFRLLKACLMLLDLTLLILNNLPQVACVCFISLDYFQENFLEVFEWHSLFGSLLETTYETHKIWQILEPILVFGAFFDLVYAEFHWLLKLCVDHAKRGEIHLRIHRLVKSFLKLLVLLSCLHLLLLQCVLKLTTLCL